MIGLMDCNNFFVSCERLFRPDLLKRPVVVLSSNDGCVVSRSQEVKDMGIPMGIPYFEIQTMCKKEGIEVFSSNFTLYRDVSSRMMTALREEFTVIEEYSIDESFFEVNDDLTVQELHSLRDRIIQKTGIPVSIGVASTKTLAKIANDMAKRGNGVSKPQKSDWNKLLVEISCGSVWGIGRQTTQKLTHMGIKTVNDFLSIDPSIIKNEFGVVGERLQLELKGIPTQKVGEYDDTVEKSISSTRSFSRKTHDRAILLSALGHHTSEVSRKLRERDHLAAMVTVLLAPSRFSEFAFRKTTASSVLLSPTNDTVELMQAVEVLFLNLYDPEIPYGKAGVTLHGILPAEHGVSSLFHSQHTHDREKVLETVDELNERYGHETVRLGIIGQENRWRERAKLRSPEYTTKWSQIPSVKAI